MTTQIDTTGSSVSNAAEKSDFIPPTSPPPYEIHDSARLAQSIPPPTATTVQPGTGVTVVFSQPVGPKPTAVTCWSCNIPMTTKVIYTPSARTHICALTLCLCRCWPCMWIPYCLESCNNVDHYCSNCKAYIGTYNQ